VRRARYYNSVLPERREDPQRPAGEAALSNQEALGIPRHAPAPGAWALPLVRRAWHWRARTGRLRRPARAPDTYGRGPVTRRRFALAVVAFWLFACASAAAQEAIPPGNITPPQVTGNPIDGVTLTADPGQWSGSPPPSFAFEWRRCNPQGGACEPIPGATNDAYTLQSADVGMTIRVRVTASNNEGKDSVDSTATAVVAPAPPVNTVLPATNGTPREGHALSAYRGQWTGTQPLALTVRWERCNAAATGCAPIPGAASDGYVLTSADVGMTLRVAVSASNAGGELTARSPVTAVIAPAPLVNLEPPAVVGAPRLGGLLRATTGRWGPSAPREFRYRWLGCRADGSDCAPLPRANGARYEIRQLDLGSRLRVRVTAIGAAGSATSDSALTSVVTAPLGASALRLMRPFPRVRIKGYFTHSGAVLSLVTVRGPRQARIAVWCRGDDCPFPHRARRLGRRVRIRSLERYLRAGTRIVVRVTRARLIGKYTRITIRADRPPARRDRCVMPGHSAPILCPAT
jgi:hypothetical protein